MTYHGLEGMERLEEVAALLSLALGSQRSPESVAHQLKTWNPANTLRRWGAVEPGGKMTGLARVCRFAPGAPLQVLVATLPNWRGQGIGSRLLDLAWEEVVADGGGYAAAWVDRAEPGSVAWAEKRGFVVQNETLRSELPLSADLAPRWKEKVEGLTRQGLRLTRISDEDTTEMRRAFFEAYSVADQDTPNLEELGRYDWDSFVADIYSAGWFRPEGAFMAWDGEEIVGLTLGGPRPGAQGGVVITDFTGVIPSHRGRGISTGLKAAFALWALGEGGSVVETMNRSDNHPILAANRSLGFEVKGSTALLHRRVARES